MLLRVAQLFYCPQMHTPVLNTTKQMIQWTWNDWNHKFRWRTEEVILIRRSKAWEFLWSAPLSTVLPHPTSSTFFFIVSSLTPPPHVHRTAWKRAGLKVSMLTWLSHMKNNFVDHFNIIFCYIFFYKNFTSRRLICRNLQNAHCEGETTQCGCWTPTSTRSTPV